MRKQTSFEYRRLRKAGWHAQQAMRAARILTSWHRREAYDQDEPDATHCVRLTVKPDESADFEDLCGDSYSAEANPDIQRSRLEREREAFRAKVERDGVWGVIGEYWDEASQEWREADSVWGFAGYDDVLSPRENCYIPDLMASALRARTESVRTWRAMCKAAP